MDCGSGNFLLPTWDNFILIGYVKVVSKLYLNFPYNFRYAVSIFIYQPMVIDTPNMNLAHKTVTIFATLVMGLSPLLLTKLID